ncbi:MAG: family peptidase [Chitinophagaceae bacterium]|nr:family peptidase [Chitinophagaceae bacterium]
MKNIIFLWLALFCSYSLLAQPPKGLSWSKDGNSYYESGEKGIVRVQLPSVQSTVIADKSKLTPAGQTAALAVRNFFFSADENRLLIYTNSQKVWRYDTRGDYWVLDLKSNKLKQVGKQRPVSSLMYAKFSPDGNKVAYVSQHNLFVEDINSGVVKQLTTDGTDKMINGTFDWAYEEEFGCRDGFRWSPDGKSIAYWQIDARKIGTFLLIDNTDSIYSFTKPVEYPKVGSDPSACKIGVVDITTGKTNWMKVPGDPVQHYIPRMEWAHNSSEIILQQLNRKQNDSKIFLVNAKTGSASEIYHESDKAWIDIKSRWHDDDPSGWEWLQNGQSFLWVSEKDGWRQLYVVSKDGRSERLLTKGDYDIIDISAIDEGSGYVYFTASPQNATQQYLYRITLDGSESFQLVTPAEQSGTHSYEISPNGKIAQHSFTSVSAQPVVNWVSLPGHVPTVANNRMPVRNTSGVEFFKLTTEEGVIMDGWIIKPYNFDSTKKYPVVFYVYGEPAAQTVVDKYGEAGTFLYAGDMRRDGYIQVSLDNRGTPAPKGAAWRKSIYRSIGIINIRDQALAAKQIRNWPFVDSTRLAVWGWSGGGSSTLNLLFQYPGLYQTGIAIAPVANQLTYDNIYQERYMGLPQENKQDFIKGSPVTYAKNLTGKLLLVHGTGDDNVHYQNSEMLINELVKANKVFQLMSYPNRTHNINEGLGTFRHLGSTFTEFLKRNCPPGGR